MSIRHGGSRFARDLENIAQLGYTEWVENVVDSTRFDRIDTTCFLLCRFDIPEVDLSETYIESTSYESSQIVKNLRRIDSSLLSRFKNEEGSCISRFVRGTLRFDSIRTESIRTTGSQEP